MIFWVIYRPNIFFFFFAQRRTASLAYPNDEAWITSSLCLVSFSLSQGFFWDWSLFSQGKEAFPLFTSTIQPALVP